MTNSVNDHQNNSYGQTNHPTCSLNATRIASGSQACAACKYQRRRCAPDCLLAPYFPVERQKDFSNAHKLFGVSNILKVIKNVAPFQRDNAMKALIFESNIHAGDPVGGCYRIIMNLQRLINIHQMELQFVYGQIFQAKARAVNALEQRNNINIKTYPGINSLEPSPLRGGFNGSSIKVEEFETNVEVSSSKEEFETNVEMSSSKGKQLAYQLQNLGISSHILEITAKAKGVATSDDKVVSKTRVN